MAAYHRSTGLAAYQSVAAHGSVAAADAHQLIVMLIDGALERIAGARGAVDNDAPAVRVRMIYRAIEIIAELRASLNFEVGGEIAANLGDLYDYCSHRLMKANVESNAAMLDEVAQLLREIRSAWIAIPAAARVAP